MPLYRAAFVTAFCLCVHLSLGIKIATLSSQPSTAFGTLRNAVCGDGGAECKDVSQTRIGKIQAALARGDYDGVLVEVWDV